MITISENIKGEIAERVVEQAHPGYMAEYQGEWYVVNGTRLMHHQSNAQWTPWQDDDDVISVDDLVMLYGGGEADNAEFGNYARTQIDWTAYDEDMDLWRPAYFAVDSNDPNPDDYEIVDWAEEHFPGAAQRLREIDAAQWEIEVEFALGYVPDNYDEIDYAARWGE